jgi:hypothetical protein
MSTALVVVPVIVSTVIVGALIGAVGIGGVLLTPALVYLAGLDIHRAMGTSMLAFVFTGIVGTATYARRGSLDWSAGAPIAGGAVPGSLLGAWANGPLPESVLKVILAGLLVAVGTYTVAGAGRARAVRAPGAPALAAVGAVIGFGSGLTGTGGPVLAVPALLLLGLAALPAVAISQLCQLPVAIFGTIGFLLYGHVDVLLGLGLGVLASGAVVVGACIAHAASAARLRIAVALACVGAGVAIAVATALG